MPRTVSFRIEDDLDHAIELWLRKNPDLSMTAVTNMALRRFVSQPHVLEPVETTFASKEEVEKTVHDMMIKHGDMLEKLK